MLELISCVFLLTKSRRWRDGASERNNLAPLIAGYWGALLNQTKASVDVRYQFVDIEDSVCWVMQKLMSSGLAIFSKGQYGNHQSV